MAIELPTKAAIEVIASGSMKCKLQLSGLSFSVFLLRLFTIEMRFPSKIIICPKYKLG